MRKTESRPFAIAVGLTLGALCAATLAGCATPSGIGDQFGLSPHWTWKTLETRHFRISYPEELQDAAKRSGLYLEEAHTLLSSRLKWESKGKVQVLVVDNEDAANGLTSPIARLGMVFYVTPPDNWFSTYYYDDWLRLLAIHEYTHFLNMDPTSEFWDALRVAFGDSLLPNSTWPSWMLEGLAVYMETRLTSGGRGRSPYYEMILRAAVEADVLDSHEFVTLDRVNGHNPYYPAGETAYLFGYQLMNRLAGGPTASGESALGEMSWRSSARVPFFINGNVESISGKDWYTLWDEWVTETRSRAEAQLSKIRSKPLTSIKKITHGGRQTLGAAFSPDGRWMAWTQDTGSERMSLWLKDRSSGRVRKLEDKILGSSIAFTPDSSAVLLSSLRRNSNYTLYSDLGIHDLLNGKTTWLTDGLRARDPHVSPDGRRVVFTLTSDSTTGLALATLERDGNDWKLGSVEPLFTPSKYDALHTPKFSADGKRVVFSWHPNGKAREDLAEIDLGTRQVNLLVSDGRFNRFPTIATNGTVHFVSDRTGVENVYRLGPSGPIQLTNVTTGLSFPSVSPEGNLHANVFSHTGWDLAELEIGSDRAPSESIEGAPAPVAAELPARDAASDTAVGDVSAYSSLPTLWPRQWSPLLVLRNSGAYVGAQAAGFDAVDLHRYFVAGAYDTQIRKGDWSVFYANRQLGPTLTVTGENTTDSLSADSAGNLLSYVRTLELGASLSFPIRGTWSVITPSLGMNSERSTLFVPGYDPAHDDIYSRSRYVPSIDAIVSYSGTRGSALSISSEEGRNAALGARVYFDDETPTWKALAKAAEYVRVTEHSVLVPSIKASWTSRRSSYSPALVNVSGRYKPLSITFDNLLDSVFQTISGDSLNELSIRGYPNLGRYVRAAGGASLDYRFPLLRIFRGWGTNPAYLESLFGFAFAEATYFPDALASATLPAAGGGLRLSGELFLNLPLVLSAEYHHGFRQAYGGGGEFFFQMGFSHFGF